MNRQAGQVVAKWVGVGKRFDALAALVDVELDLRAGEVLALLGPNGAGKTTSVAIALGLLAPDAGRVEVFGASPRALGVRRRMGVMLQTAGLPDMLTPAELLLQARAAYPAPLATAECVRLAGLEGLLDRRYGRLSGGQQRRVQFALAICGRPELLFLDEPTTGLDVEARERLWQAIRGFVAEGAAVLLTTHYLEEAEALADRVAVIADGRLVASGALAEVRERVAQRRVRCRTTLAPAEIAAWPGVEAVTPDGDALEIRAHAAEALVARLLAADPSLSGLEVRRGGLAEALATITAQAA